jgi:hypothetical protein
MEGPSVHQLSVPWVSLIERFYCKTIYLLSQTASSLSCIIPSFRRLEVTLLSFLLGLLVYICTGRCQQWPDETSYSVYKERSFQPQPNPHLPCSSMHSKHWKSRNGRGTNGGYTEVTCFWVRFDVQDILIWPTQRLNFENVYDSMFCHLWGNWAETW